MSNRLSFAHLVPHREPHEIFAPATPPGAFAAALSWLNGFADTGLRDLSAALRRDLGLPAAQAEALHFASLIERSRVRV